MLRHLFAWLAAAAFLAGCSDSPSSSADLPEDTEDPMGSEHSMHTPAPAVMAAAPIYINGTLDTAGGCATDEVDLPAADTQDVPTEAWNRSYEGPTAYSGQVSGVGELCVLWLDSAGEALPDNGMVPEGAVQAEVRGMLQVGISYSIRVD